MQPKTFPASTDKFLTVSGLTVGLPYYATVRITHSCALLLDTLVYSALVRTGHHAALE